jgi:ATP-dependent DNA helicase RecG
MNKQSLAKLIKAGESETLEFKERWTDTALETLSAFANQQGGRLLIGVTDDGDLRGWNGKDAELNALASKISDLVKIQPSVEQISVNNCNVVVIAVIPSGLPIAYHGRYFKRVAGTTREMNADELGRLFLTKMGITWDSIEGAFNWDEFDLETINDFINNARPRLPHLNQNEPVSRVFEKLELLHDGKPTRGALMLFGKNPQRHFVSAQVHIGRFREGGIIADDKLLTGNLFRLLNKAMELLSFYLKVRLEINHHDIVRDASRDLRRKEIWDYPLDALREALLNALIHRDYFDASGDIMVRVHDNRIIISNPGELPAGMTVDELKVKGHRSVPRNPLMAKALYYSGLIEKWGTGTTRMIEVCLENGLPEPEFKSGKGWFEISFSTQIYRDEVWNKLGLNERQIQAMQYLNRVGRITNAEYRRFIGVPVYTAKRDLAVLVEKGLLKKEGPAGKAVYYVLDEMKYAEK